MKREILFRGKCQETGTWVYGLPITETTLSNTISHIAQFSGTERKFGRTNVMIIPETIGQFTGLTDKNGVKIFEGDLLTHNKIIFIVKYSKNQHNLLIREYNDKRMNWRDLEWVCRVRKYIEIIGNIHE